MEYSERKTKIDSMAYASDRCECIFFMLSRSGFAPCATIFPADDIITHPPADSFLDFVPSIAILIGVPSWIHVARLSGYSRNICCNRCFFHNWRFLKYSMNDVGLGLLIVVSCEFTWMVNLF